MTESKIYACIIVTTMILCSAVVFVLNPILQTSTIIKLNNEWGAYVYSMNMLPFNEPTHRIAIAQRNIKTPIEGFEFKGMIPVKAYLVDGTTRAITWQN